MKFYLPIAKIDAEQRLVEGYASTEARDDQGEVVRRDALASALGDYMKFANIREMHQLSAVGKAKDAAVDDKGLYVAAKVVDDNAWNKVKEGVYSGFSIGGKLTSRDPGDYKTITGLRLDEISLVDRSANPEAVFDCWKRAKSESRKDIVDPVAELRAAIARVEALVKGGDAPGEGDKPYGDVDYADPGYREGKKRYPVDSEGHIRAAWNYIHKPKNAGEYSAEQLSRIKAKIIAAWKDKIDPKGPPEAADGEKAARVQLKKHLADVGEVAQVILALDWLKDRLATEAIVEGDDSEQPRRLEAIVEELCGFLNALVAEETAEIESDSEVMGPAGEPETALMAAVASSLRKSGLAGRAKAFEALAKARHSAGDQALLDAAHHAVEAARSIDGLTKAEMGHLDDCMECMKAAGARESSGEDSTQDSFGTPPHKAPTAKPPAQEYRPGVYTTVNSAEHTKAMLEMIAAALGKRGKAHVALLSVAHHALHKMTDGAVCAAEKAGGRHSKETLANLKEAHDHICAAAGAECPGSGMMDDGRAGAEEEREGTEEDGAKAARGDGPGSGSGAGLKKRYDALAAAVAEMAPRLDAILKTVEKIDRTPLPPLTRSALGLTRVEKGRGEAEEESDEALMARLARMSPDEQAMLLVKAARRQPRILGGPAPISPRPADNG